MSCLIRSKSVSDKVSNFFWSVLECSGIAPEFTSLIYKEVEVDLLDGYLRLSVLCKLRYRFKSDALCGILYNRIGVKITLLIVTFNQKQKRPCSYCINFVCIYTILIVQSVLINIYYWQPCRLNWNYINAALKINERSEFGSLADAAVVFYFQISVSF